MTDPSQPLLHRSKCANPYCDGEGLVTTGATATANAYRIPCEVCKRLMGVPGLIAGGERVHVEGLEDEIAKLREALTVLRDACGHCLAGKRPPNQQMIDGADAALRGDWVLSP